MVLSFLITKFISTKLIIPDNFTASLSSPVYEGLILYFYD